jgi:hypothetical protein
VVGVEDLYRDVAVVREVARREDRTAPAAAEHLADLVRPDAGPPSAAQALPLQHRLLQAVDDLRIGRRDRQDVVGVGSAGAQDAVEVLGVLEREYRQRPQVHETADEERAEPSAAPQEERRSRLDSPHRVRDAFELGLDHRGEARLRRDRPEALARRRVVGDDEDARGGRHGVEYTAGNQRVVSG